MLRSPNGKCQSNPDISNASGTGTTASKRKRKQPESEIGEAIKNLSQELNNKLEDWRAELHGAISKVAENISNIQLDIATIFKVTTEIKEELNSLRSDHTSLAQQVCDQGLRIDGMSDNITSLTKSVQYTMEQQEDLKKRLDIVYERSGNMEDTNNFTGRVELRLDALEQQARQCNLELCNIPEKRNENLLVLMESISSKINFSLCQKDIIAIHRVPHAHKESRNPKNIIVKLSSRILRDNLLSAYRLAKGLNTGQLGFAGASHRIYMHEHLTLKNKLLFRRCREAATKNGYKYVWVKHATILVRETDSEQAIAIRSEPDITKIKPRTKKAQ